MRTEEIVQSIVEDFGLPLALYATALIEYNVEWQYEGTPIGKSTEDSKAVAFVSLRNEETDEDDCYCYSDFLSFWRVAEIMVHGASDIEFVEVNGKGQENQKIFFDFSDENVKGWQFEAFEGVSIEEFGAIDDMDEFLQEYCEETDKQLFFSFAYNTATLVFQNEMEIELGLSEKNEIEVVCFNGETCESTQLIEVISNFSRTNISN